MSSVPCQQAHPASTPCQHTVPAHRASTPCQHTLPAHPALLHRPPPHTSPLTRAGPRRAPARRARRLTPAGPHSGPRETRGRGEVREATLIPASALPLCLSASLPLPPSLPTSPLLSHFAPPYPRPHLLFPPPPPCGAGGPVRLIRGAPRASRAGGQARARDDAPRLLRAPLAQVPPRRPSRARPSLRAEPRPLFLVRVASLMSESRHLPLRVASESGPAAAGYGPGRGRRWSI
jgi:hypothetical protein